MVTENLSIRSKKTFWFFLFFSFILWLLPFILRLFFFDIANFEKHPPEKSLNVVSDITNYVANNDKWSVFIAIFSNNLKVCVINIVGGVMLGILTLSNLIMNGFYAADVFATAYNNGIGVTYILKTTLPHSFELIGIWLSGAVGFSIAKLIIDFMRGRDNPYIIFFRFIGKCVLFIVLIILFAALIESYISIPYQ